MPVPVGGRYIQGNLDMHRKLSGEDVRIPPDTNPKRYDFDANFLGHKDRATIDEQMMGVIDPGGPQAPQNNAYGLHESPVHELARQKGTDPRNAQELVWAGGKAMRNEAKNTTRGRALQGKPMIGFVNEAIERTHRLTGMPREEIVRRGIIGSEIPVYGLGAGLAASLAASGYLGEDEGPF